MVEDVQECWKTKNVPNRNTESSGEVEVEKKRETASKRTQGLFLERKEYRINELDVFNIVVDHIVEFQSLQMR